MKYTFSFTQPSSHLLDIRAELDGNTGKTVQFQLPAWRPGRYELGNFAKNIKGFSAQDRKGNPLPFRKVTKDLWEVETGGTPFIEISYQYYSAELNAGSTYLDADQLYVNPVNCCMYVPDRINDPCEVNLQIPDSWRVACSMPPVQPHKKQEDTRYKKSMKAADFHELADSPWIASAGLKHNVFFLDGVEFNLWFQGECKPNWPKLINDFFIFINEQFVTMQGPIPSKEYHFLFQILPYRFHHGVEHLRSTVIALGPSYELMEGDTFQDLLGVSSHELFHAWNIKAIRPAEMHPYDYTRENYSRLGYVCEGVTTYYGDFLLYRSGVYSDSDLFREFNRHIQVHMDQAGKFNLSVADSSFDTWLDGYAEIVPHRKTSIYSEGCLIAWMTDLLIRRYSKNTRSLDDVMRHLYTDFYGKGKGYTEEDYIRICGQMAGESLNEFFLSYAYKPVSYENALIECIEHIGIQLVKESNKKHHERHFGLRIADTGAVSKVIAVYPGSPADRGGLEPGDELISVNGFPVRNNFGDWSLYFGSGECSVLASGRGRIKEIVLKGTGEHYYPVYSFRKSDRPSEQQKQAFRNWSRRPF